MSGAHWTEMVAAEQVLIKEMASMILPDQLRLGGGSFRLGGGFCPSLRCGNGINSRELRSAMV